jgi:hypothetical protein
MMEILVPQNELWYESRDTFLSHSAWAVHNPEPNEKSPERGQW